MFTKNVRFKQVLVAISAAIALFSVGFGQSAHAVVINIYNTYPASNVGATSATLNGGIMMGGTATSCWFEYGTTGNLGTSVGNQNVNASAANVYVATVVTGLQPGTTYSFQFACQVGANIERGDILNFTTAGQSGNPPTVVTNSESSLSQNSATLNGQLNPNGFSSNYWFEYGQTSSLGQTTAAQNAGSGVSNVSAQQIISTLTANTAYYFRLVAQNQYGTTQGQILNFTTQNGGGAATLIVSPSSATINSGSGTALHAVYDPDGAGSEQQQDVTSAASWSSSNTSIANVSAGYVSGNSNGVATISINYSGLSANATVSVIGSGGSAPIVQTLNASNSGNSYATLNGQVNPNNSNTNYWFEYGTSYSLGQTIGYQSAGSGNSSQNVSYTVTNLNQGSSYFYRLVAQNQYGTTQGQIMNFSVSGGGCGYNGCNNSAPIATTNYVSNLNNNSATLNGSISSNGTNTNYWFEYGQGSSLGQTTGFQYIGSYGGSQNVSAPIYNLLTGMNYYYRVVAQNQYGTSYGSIINFTTNGQGGGSNCNNNYNYNGSNSYGAPCVQTNAPNNVTNVGATFNGQVTSQSNTGDTVTAWFEYGINSNSFTYTTNNSLIPPYSNNYSYATGVSNLIPGTTYYLRAAARNSYGTSYGQSYQFTTTGSGGSSVQPTAETRVASYVAKNSALLNGVANPNGSLGMDWFEYGPTVALGLKTLPQSLGSGTNSVAIGYALTGLQAGTTYYYRAVAQTSVGTVYGSILNMTTLTGGVIPIPNPPTPNPNPNPNPTPAPNPAPADASCVKLTPSFSNQQITPGSEFSYVVHYENNCLSDLSSVSLKVAMPAEVSFVSTNIPFANRDQNTLTYNLGAIQKGAQGIVEIKNKVSDTAAAGDTLLYGATLNWNDLKGRFNTTSAYMTSVLAAAPGKSGFASLTSIFSGWTWVLLVLILIILCLVYWIFFRKTEKTAVQKIEQTIS